MIEIWHGTVVNAAAIEMVALCSDDQTVEVLLCSGRSLMYREDTRAAAYRMVQRIQGKVNTDMALRK